MAMIHWGFFGLNDSQLSAAVSCPTLDIRTRGPRNQWDVANCLYWKCLDPIKRAEFQVLGGQRIIRYNYSNDPISYLSYDLCLSYSEAGPLG